MVLTPIVRALAGRIKTLYPNSTDVLSILSKVLENGSDAVSARAPRIGRAQLEVTRAGDSELGAECGDKSLLAKPVAFRQKIASRQ